MAAVSGVFRGARGRWVAAIAVGVVTFFLLFANSLAMLYTDLLWFTALEFESIWSKILVTKIALALTFTVVFFLVLWVNLVVADRLAPGYRPVSGQDDLIERYHQVLGHHAGKIRLAVSAIFALVAGANTSRQWQEWLLFRNGQSFGWKDPLYNLDASFYIFELPFWSFVVDWFFATFILTVIVSAAAHYLNGGIYPTGQVERVSAGVKVHLSVLLALVALVRAAAYWLDRYELVTSTRGVYDGALATDVTVQRPAYSLLAFISVSGAVVFLWNIRRKGWGLPLVAITLWMASHVLVGNVFPALYQRLRVDPQVSTREQEFVEDNIAATRFAYGLDEANLRTEKFEYTTGVTSADLADYGSVFENVPLIDPELSRDSFVRSQGERAFYRFSTELDVGRYRFDGELRPVVLAARGLDLTVEAVEQTWEHQHVQYTHGYGVAMAAGWEADSSGRPEFVVRGLGDVGIDERLDESLEQPRIYVAEDFHGYAIVNAERDEIDYQTASNESRSYRFDAEKGAVPMGSLFRRAAMALRFRELDPLVTSELRSDSRVIFNRDVEHRVRTLAPFLRFDSDVYPVIADGAIYWVVDGYTTADGFPYSQRVDTKLANSDVSRGYNYIRNSVKAIVNAYDGTVQLYIVDEEDPIIQSWAKVFPDLFAPVDQISPALQDNLRYPTDIFTVQTDMWETYVVSDPVELVQRDVAWSVAAEPPREARDADGEAAPMDPQYLITRLPGAESPEFVLQRAFVPRGQAGSVTARPELTGLMVARSDPENYGQLVLYEIPAGLVDAPDFVHAEIRKNDELTNFIREKEGSTVQFGQMTLLLVNDTIVYVRPVYVESRSPTAVPELSRVIAVNGDQIAMASTLDEVLADLANGGVQNDTDDRESDDEGRDDNDAGEVDADATDDGNNSAGRGDVGGSEGDSNSGTADGPSQPPSSDAYDPTGRSVVEILQDAEELLRSADLAEAADDPAEAEALRSQARSALESLRLILGG